MKRVARATAALTAAAAVAWAAAPVSAQPRFTDVTVPAGLGSPVDVQGVAWGDADGDGDLDIYLTLVLSPLINSGKRLYRNDGGDRFTEISAQAGVSDDQTGFGACFADFDEDGDDDLGLANGLVNVSFLANAFRLFVNDGAGNFSQEAGPRGLTGPGSGRTLTWADHDDDGDLDIFLATPWIEKNWLYRNDAGAFVDASAAAGVGQTANSNGAAWADYDGDGDEDLYVANQGVPFIPEPNWLYRNRGDGTFDEVGGAAGVGGADYSNGAAWGDCDNDADLDLYVANGGVTSIFGLDAPNRLYRNEGDGTFTNVAAAAGVEDRTVVSFSAAWGDLDNDGWLDLYVTNSPLNTSTPGNRLFRNLGNCTFEDVATAAGVDDSGSGQGTALGDHDSDGDLDIFVANLFSDTNVTAHLYRNDSPRQAWLHVDTVGTDSNRDGVGALLFLRDGARTQLRHVHAGHGYLSQDSFDAEFGLGAAASADELEIRWPSGCVQLVPTPPLDARMVVVEDCVPGFDALAAADDRCTGGITLSWDPAAFASGSGHHEVRRGRSCDDAGRSAELLPRPTGGAFLDASTSPGETWFYEVRAVDDVNGTFTWRCAGPVTDDTSGAGARVDPASLRVARVGLEDPRLAWSLLDPAGISHVHRSLVAADFALAPAVLPPILVAAPTPDHLDPGLVLGRGGVAFYQVHDGACAP